LTLQRRRPKVVRLGFILFEKSFCEVYDKLRVCRTRWAFVSSVDICCKITSRGVVRGAIQERLEFTRVIRGHAKIKILVMEIMESAALAAS
jgi:hypothetical protein